MAAQSVFYQFNDIGEVVEMICNTRDHFDGEDFPVRTFSLDRLKIEDISNVLVFPVRYDLSTCVPPPPNTPSSEDMASAVLEDWGSSEDHSRSDCTTVPDDAESVGEEVGEDLDEEGSEEDEEGSEEETAKSDVTWHIEGEVLHVDYGNMEDLDKDPLFRGFRIHIVMREKPSRWPCIIL